MHDVLITALAIVIKLMEYAIMATIVISPASLVLQVFIRQQNEKAEHKLIEKANELLREARRELTA